MMSSRRLARMCRQVANSLERDTVALIEGRFADLSRMQTDSNQLIERFLKEAEGIQTGESSLSAVDRRELLAAVDSMRSAARRNGAALTGALRGLKAGRARLDEWLCGPSSVAAYGADGTRPRCSALTGRTTRRV